MENLVALRAYARPARTRHRTHRLQGKLADLVADPAGAEVTGLSDGIPTNPSHFQSLGLDLDDRRGDVCDAASVEQLVAETRPQLIFHFAAQSLVRRAYSEPVATYRTNVLGTAVVLEAARRNHVPATILATTDKVYRNDETGRHYDEADELGGVDPYSASKACAEIVASSYRESLRRQSGTLIATVRAGNVIGGGDWSDDRLIPDLMRAASADRAAVIRNPEFDAPVAAVLDVLAGYLVIGARLLNGEQAASGPWNLGPVSSTNVRVIDMLEVVRARLPGLSIILQPDRAASASPLCCNSILQGPWNSSGGGRAGKGRCWSAPSIGMRPRRPVGRSRSTSSARTKLTWPEMQIVSTAIAGAFVIRHDVHADTRGLFKRQYCELNSPRPSSTRDGSRQTIPPRSAGARSAACISNVRRTPRRSW